MQTIICMKWGVAYPSFYVNRLWRAIKRNTERETRLICYTDDSSGIDSDIITVSLPNITVPDITHRTRKWIPGIKLSLFRGDLTDGTNLLSGDILFLDLDIVITGCIDHFFDYAPGRFCIANDWTSRYKFINGVFQRAGNTSVYRFPFGQHSYVYDNFVSNSDDIVERYTRSQEYVTSMVSDKLFWPRRWCVSFRRNLLPVWPLNFIFAARLPVSALIVAFAGHPNQVIASKGGWWGRRGRALLYQYLRPTPWINEHWR